jgi:predicted DNA-binding transcriptional regulator YafY
VLPDDLREDLDATALLVGPRADHLETIDLGVVRQAIREERKLGFVYRDAGGSSSMRMVWPFALAFFDKVRVMAAWCETRGDFRHFRADRMSDLTATDIRYPRRRQAMLKEWKATLDAPGRSGAKDASD